MPNATLLDERWNLASEKFEQGDGVGALYLYKSLAATGDSWALVEIGNIHELVAGVPIDCQEAAKWYRGAVFKVGDAKAHLALARMYFNGDLVAEDSAAAFMRHVSVAAEHGGMLSDDHRVAA